MYDWAREQWKFLSMSKSFECSKLNSKTILKRRRKAVNSLTQVSYKGAYAVCGSTHGGVTSLWCACWPSRFQLTPEPTIIYFILLGDRQSYCSDPIVWTFRPFVSLYTVGRRAFLVSGATVWNDLPLHVASAPSLAVFRWLKTFLFSRSYQDTTIWLVCYYHHSSLLSGHPWSLQ